MMRLALALFMAGCTFSANAVLTEARLCSKATTYPRFHRCVRRAVLVEGAETDRAQLLPVLSRAKKHVDTYPSDATRVAQMVLDLIQDRADAESEANAAVTAAVAVTLAVAAVVVVAASSHGSDEGRLQRTAVVAPGAKSCSSRYDCWYGDVCCRRPGSFTGLCATPADRTIPVEELGACTLW